MAQPKLFITGASGRIGRILWHALSGEYDLYGLDVDPAGDDRITRADISDLKQVEAALSAAGPLTLLVHLAADPRVDAPWDVILHSNIAGTRNVYEAARRHGIRRIVFASSNHVTGAYEGFAPDLFLHPQPEPEKLTVHDPIRPDSDYGVSKAFGEALARYYAARWGIASICLRIGSLLAGDDPGDNLRQQKTWLSHRDLVQLVRCSLQSDVPFGIYYGISANTGRFWSIENARRELGYAPQDNAARRTTR
mgnify:CR=1 FL=1